MKDDPKFEIMKELKKRKEILRLFEAWVDGIEVEQLDKIANVVHSLLGNLPDDAIDLIYKASGNDKTKK